MACFKPIAAWRLANGSIHFGAEKPDSRSLELPCGRCIGCRISKTQEWAIRCMHEASCHDTSAFITLTYDDDHYTPTLDYRDFQQFMKKLRKKKGPTRFFACGEYGDTTGRAHWHALLFGQQFKDRTQCGKDLYRSNELDELWKKGFASIGEVTYQSAAYVARYACKKISGPMAARHYERVDERTGEITNVAPEMGRMSLRPGIGEAWILKNWKEVYIARDAIVMAGGKAHKAPRYYDKKLEKIDTDLREHKTRERYEKAKIYLGDQTEQRLRDREICAKARMKQQRTTI